MGIDYIEGKVYGFSLRGANITRDDLEELLDDLHTFSFIEELHLFVVNRLDRSYSNRLSQVSGFRPYDWVCCNTAEPLTDPYEELTPIEKTELKKINDVVDINQPFKWWFITYLSI